MKTSQSTKWNIDIKEIFRKNGLLVSFIILCIFLAIFAPAFLSIGNITNILRTCSISGLVAVGMTYVILAGGIDLSVAGTIAFTGALGSAWSYTPGVALTVPIIVGVGIGLLIGILITRFRIQPFIITYGMGGVLKGAALIFTGGSTIYDLSDPYCYIGGGNFLGIPVPIWIFVVIVIISFLLIHKSKFGRYIYSVGSNEEASRLSGINTRNIKVVTYVIAGGLAGLAGIILTSRVQAAEPTAGNGWDFDAIAAVVIGGNSMNGGQGGLFYTLIGIFIIGVINNGMTLVGVPSFWIQLIRGLVIILAVLADRKD